MKAEQKRLYNHYLDVAENYTGAGATKIKAKAKRHAAEIDESFDFSGKQAKAAEAAAKKEEKKESK